MTKIVIVMDGGLIQNIIADGAVEILVKDYDTEGVPDDIRHDKDGAEYIGWIEDTSSSYALWANDVAEEFAHNAKEYERLLAEEKARA